MSEHALNASTEVVDGGVAATFGIALTGVATGLEASGVGSGTFLDCGALADGDARATRGLGEAEGGDAGLAEDLEIGASSKESGLIEAGDAGLAASGRGSLVFGIASAKQLSGAFGSVSGAFGSVPGALGSS